MQIKQILKLIPAKYAQPLRYCYGLLPLSFRLGKTFRSTYALLKKTQFWTEQELAEYQFGQLKKLLEFSVRHVPYYKELFAKNQIMLSDFKTKDDIRKIPFLTKTGIITNREALTAGCFPKKEFILATTGGSSGLPLSFYRQNNFSRSREEAFIAALWDRVGFRYGRDARLVLRGNVVKELSGIEYRPDTKEWICSTYYMDAAHLRSYYKLMTSKKLRFIHGHVSSIVLFAQFLVDHGLVYPVKAVLGASEKVFPFQRKLVRKAFGVDIFSWYGQTEQVALAGACEHSAKYHIFPEYGLLELIDAQGSAIREVGVVGEIVATGFNNYVMPLIRYRTGDLAKYADGFCTDCGRKYRLLDGVEGRNYEYVFTKTGQKVSLTGLIFGQHFASFEHIVKLQVLQKEFGRIEIKIVPGKRYSSRQVELEIRQVIAKAVGGQLELSFSYCDEIKTTIRGKHQFLIQELTEQNN
jgi:phenylacetate-CoA ligase